MVEIENFIRVVREISPLMETICKKGSCYRLHLLLKEVFPNAKPFYDENYHVVTEFEGKFYDISGEYLNQGKNYPRPMTLEEIESQKQYVCDIQFTAIAK